MRVLVVEDHIELSEVVASGLRREGFAVDVVADGAAALANAQVYEYEVIVLDRDIPEIHGDEVCRRLAVGGGRSRVLMLTASGEIEDRVQGLSIGADDYLTKPFAFAELVARVRALARRAQPALPPVLRKRRHLPRHGQADGHPGRTAARVERQGVRGVGAADVRLRERRSPPRSCWRVPGTRPPTLSAMSSR